MRLAIFAMCLAAVMASAGCAIQMGGTFDVGGQLSEEGEAINHSGHIKADITGEGHFPNGKWWLRQTKETINGVKSLAK